MTQYRAGLLALVGLGAVGVGLFMAWIPAGIVYAGAMLIFAGKVVYDEASDGSS